MLDITTNQIMALKTLVQDQIDNLFRLNPALEQSDKDIFEIAVCHFANLKYLGGIESDDLMDGILGKGGDEGIDMCYVFCNGVLVKDELHPVNADSTIKVKFFQAKRVDGFETDGFRKLKEGIEEIFNLDLPLKELATIGANEGLVEKADLIRNIFRIAQTQRAKFSCEVYYSTESVELKVSEKIKYLEKGLKENPFGIPYKVEYWNAQKLLDLNKKSDELLEIKFDTQIVTMQLKDIPTSGKCGFVKGNDLMDCLIDKENGFKSHLTEGNVRYFLGEDKKINKSIIDTAMDESKAPIFWAMNNGITIIGEDIVPVDANVYNIKNPQIVNGCQTIHCLHHAFATNNKNKLPDNLRVFVKLIQTGEDENVQSDIISATNSQNAVKGASLKANDAIQKNIETHLGKFGILYERRENYYKHKGFSGQNVIGLLKMAQIVHSIANKESITATNDTATLFSTNAKYQSIFSNVDFDLYLFSVRLFHKTWSLKTADIRKNKKKYSPDEKDLISKGGFVFLHIISSLMFSDAEFNERRVKKIEKFIGSLDIKIPIRKNKFSVRKANLFKMLEDEAYMQQCYESAFKLFKAAARAYGAANTNKPLNSLFKYRSFDKDYVKGILDKFVDAKATKK